MVFKKRGYGIVTNAGAILSIKAINFEIIAIVTIQTIECAEPHKTFVVLQNARYGGLR